MTKKKSTLWNIWNIIVAVLFVGIGILTCAFAGSVDFQNTIILIVGIILLVIAGLQIVAQVLRIVFAGNESTMAADFSIAGVTASELALGIVAIIVSKNPGSAEIVFKYLGYFLGIFLLSIGAIMIIYEIVFLVKKLHPVIVGVGTMIGGLVPLVLGILVIVFLNDQEKFLTFFFICLGILFILLGLAYLAIFVIKMRRERALRKAEKEERPAEETKEIVEVEGKDKPEEPEEPEAPVEEKPEE